MPDVLESKHQVRAKIVLMGPSGSGKGEILRALSGLQGSGPFLENQVGDSTICQCSWEWTGIPEPGWTLNLSAYSTVGEVDFNAVIEVLLEGVDGLIFVAPVDPSQAEEIKRSLQTLAFNLKRYDRSLASIPVTMHYHRAELMPGFDPAMLDEFLGIKGEEIPRIVTRTQGDDLTASFASVVGQILKGIDLPEGD